MFVRHSALQSSQYPSFEKRNRQMRSGKKDHAFFLLRLNFSIMFASLLCSKAKGLLNSPLEIAVF